MPICTASADVEREGLGVYVRITHSVAQRILHNHLQHRLVGTFNNAIMCIACDMVARPYRITKSVLAYGAHILASLGFDNRELICISLKYQLYGEVWEQLLHELRLAQAHGEVPKALCGVRTTEGTMGMSRTFHLSDRISKQGVY